MNIKQMRAQVERFKRTIPREEWEQRRAFAKVALLNVLKLHKLRFKWRWIGETRWRTGHPSFWSDVIALDELAAACEFVVHKDDVLKLWPAP